MFSGGRGSGVRKEFFADDGKKGAKQTPRAKCKLCCKSYARPNYGDQGLQSHMEKERKEELTTFLKKFDRTVGNCIASNRKYLPIACVGVGWPFCLFPSNFPLVAANNKNRKGLRASGNCAHLLRAYLLPTFYY